MECPDPLTPEEFQDLTGVSRETRQALADHLALLETWQRRINLVGTATLRDPWRRHVLDSAQLAGHMPRDAQTCVDIGSGAGFPGLVLARVTGRAFQLVESDARKAVFLREAARTCGASVKIHTGRIESCGHFFADVITARALAPLPTLLAYAQPHLKNDGILLLLKGKNVHSELTESQKKWKLTSELFKSRSDPNGVVLIIREISRKNAEQPDPRLG